MDDNTAALGPETGASTATQNTESTGQGQVDSQGSQGQTDNAGGEQSFSESGKDQGTDTRRPQFRSKNQTIYELRQKVREQGAYWEQEVGTLKQQLAEIQKMFGNRGQDRKPSRTFWEAPEEVLDERITGHLSEMEKRILDRMAQRDTETKETSEWKQETSEAAKFIRSQPGLTEDDILEITDLVREHPSMGKMRPQERADYALYLFGKNKGISDKTPLKNKAAIPTGSAATGKPQPWTESEIALEINKLGDPKHWNAETKEKYANLEREIRNAYRENRVKK
jgi:hypothetical protein